MSNGVRPLLSRMSAIAPPLRWARITSNPLQRTHQTGNRIPLRTHLPYIQAIRYRSLASAPADRSTYNLRITASLLLQTQCQHTAQYHQRANNLRLVMSVYSSRSLLRWQPLCTKRCSRSPDTLLHPPFRIYHDISRNLSGLMPCVQRNDPAMARQGKFTICPGWQRYFILQLATVLFKRDVNEAMRCGNRASCPVKAAELWRNLYAFPSW